MASYYFSQSTGSNTTGLGTEISPWQNFKGKKEGVSALSPGDICYFKRGDIWVGTFAEVVVNSNGVLGNYITLDAYGSGANPLFTGAAPTTTGWTYTGANSIYTLGGQSQTHLKAVTQGLDRALCQWQGTVTTLPEGTWKRLSGILYVRCWGNVNPSGAEIRVGSYAHSTGFSDGTRGLVSTSRTAGLGQYVNFKNLDILCANGVGMSSSSKGARFDYCNIVGSGMDGLLFYAELAGSGENAEYSRGYNCNISWCVSQGHGKGQGFTSYASYTWMVDSVAHDNFMAGFDFLDFSLTNTDMTECGLLRCDAYNNARYQDATFSFDPQIYVDGASEVFIYGCRVWGAGVQSGATNAKTGIVFGSEKPTNKPVENIWIVNNLVFGCHDTGISSNQICYGSTTECPPSGSTAPDNIKNIFVINNTIAAYNAGTSDRVFSNRFADTTASNWVWKNNIFISDSTSTNDFVRNGTWFDLNYNLYYRRDQSASAIIYKLSGVSHTLATWKTASSKDANSAYGNPLITLDSDTLMDAHLSVGSPAIDTGLPNAFTPPAWLPEDLFPNGGIVRGSTQVDNTIDDIVGSIDLGYHYISNYVDETIAPILQISGVSISGVTIG